MAERRPPPAECANCGAAIPPHAKACPECGADERTGWRETSVYDGLELPDEAFEATERSAARARMRTRNVNGVAWYWWAVGLGILLVFALGMLALL